MDQMEELREAIAAGNSREVSSLLSHCPPNTVNQTLDEDGTTLLHLAANTPEPAILEVLLEYGVDMHVQTSEGLTPLHVAAMCGRVDTVRELLDYGADPLVYDEEDMLPLDLAREAGHMECVDVLELWPSLHSPPSPDPFSEQTMAETFVSMYLDLTSVSQMLDESMTLLTDGGEGLQLSESEDGERSSLEELFTTALDLDRDNSPTQSHCHASLTPPPSPPKHRLNSTYVKRPASSSPSQDTNDTERAVIPPSILRLTNHQLRERLKSLGESPGPVTEHTRHPYLVYLAKLESGVRPQQTKDSSDYRYELALVLSGAVPIPDFSYQEAELFQSLRTPSFAPSFAASPRARDEMTKSHFNYLLLDPRHLQPLHSTSDELGRFRNFVEAVFYVGKGKNSRSLQHLKDAKDCLGGNVKRKPTAKLKQIHEIWGEGHGVLSLHVFPHTTAHEAFTREAAMIDAIGLHVLTNQVLGSYHGEVRGWPSGRRRQLGVYLLHRAQRVYMADPPLPIGQHDL